jgi:hypothetical protein
MPKSTFIPHSDHDFLIWMEHFIANLTPDLSTTADLAALKAACEVFSSKITQSTAAAASAKQATAEKNDSRYSSETLIRAMAKQIKARNDYTEGLGAQLGIVGPEHLFDLSTAHPNLTGIDQTAGRVILYFTKANSDGVNIYSQREYDTDWVLLIRATTSPYIDNRPLLQIGKPELRRYTAVYMLKDQDIGQFSDDLMITCAP